MVRFSSALRPRLETLEDRSLMSANIGLASGILSIVGTDAYAEQARVVLTPTGDTVQVFVTQLDDAGQIVDAQYQTFARNAVSLISFTGKAKDDTFRNLTSISCIASGGLGNDELYGGFSFNTLNGDAGDDLLRGGNLSDQLRGGDGDDTIYGGAGNDFVYGQAGRDLLYGEAGDDLLDGGYDGEVDQLYGGSGSDTFRMYRTRGLIDSLRFYEDRAADYSSAEGDEFEVVWV